MYLICETFSPFMAFVVLAFGLWYRKYILMEKLKHNFTPDKWEIVLNLFPNGSEFHYILLFFSSLILIFVLPMLLSVKTPARTLIMQK